MKRSVLIAIVAGAIGLAVFAATFSRTSEAARFDYHLDRTAAITAARSIALQWGIDASSWPAESGTVKGEPSYLRKYRHVPAVRELSALDTFVVLRDRTRKESVRVQLDHRGQLVRLILPPTAKATEVLPTDAAARAEAALRRSGADLSGYRRMPPEKRESRDRFRWEKEVAGAPGLTLFAEVELEKGVVRKLTRDWSLSQAYLRSAEPKDAAVYTIVTVLLITPVVAFILFIRSMIRRNVQVRLLRRLAAIAFVLLVLAQITAPTLSNTEFTGSADRTSPIVYGHDLGDLDTWLDVFLAPALLALLWSILWGGGFAALRRVAPEAAADFEDLVRGRFHRSQGAALAGGFAAAGVLAAIPHLVALTGLFGDVAVRAGRAGFLALDLPLVFNNFMSVTAVLIGFAFVVPLLESATRRNRLALIAAIAVGGALLLPGRSDFSLFGYAFATAIAAVLYAVYRSFGLVGVLGATVMVNVITASATLLVQPSAAARSYGTALIAGAAAAMIGALALALRGREAVRTALAAESESLTERQRIQAEFEFARRAQEKMLPAAAPTIAGLSIDGICRPAQQVGGDLYDYIPLRDGKICIVVADVCGKGVPAAMYMTMVKGLLLAATDFSSDPLEIAAEVNAGLHTAARRKVFVTMFLAVLDPETRVVRYVRAGHNPPYCMRAASGDIESLEPRGMALGLVSPALFKSSLRVEELTLGPGDALVLYSDGVTEAMNGSRDEYGEDRLRQVVQAIGTADARATRERVVADVDGFVGAAPAHDDLTLVVVRAA